MLATVATAFMAQYEARQRAQAKETRSALYSPATREAITAASNEAGKQGETVVTIPGPPAGFVKA